MNMAGAWELKETAYIEGKKLRTTADSAGTEADFTVDLKVEPTGCREVPANRPR